MKIKYPEDKIYVLENGRDALNITKSIILSKTKEDAFYVLDVGDIILKYEDWRRKLPRVTPFYAVKCNDYPIVLEVLASLGANFDCASKNEIAKVLHLGVNPSRIIFANPAKPLNHIRYASEVKVNTMTFDNEIELQKVQKLFPTAQLVLRIRCDAEVVQCPLGMKFGCDPVNEAPKLLHTARAMGLNVVGISFHVGSGCGDPPVFREAIYLAHILFKLGNSLGFNMHLLDLGGGFPGNLDQSIDIIAEVVNSALEDYFPEDQGLTIIAEPGRYFVASAFTLATLIHSKRNVMSEGQITPLHSMYYINDGVYGSFNCIIYDHAVCTPIPFDVCGGEFPHGELVPSSVWGSTCDGLDKVNDDILLPEMNVGNWLIYQNMGAYTLAAASTFNGFPVPKVHAIIDEQVWSMIKDSTLFSNNLFMNENHGSGDEISLEDFELIMPDGDSELIVTATIFKQEVPTIIGENPEMLIEEEKFIPYHTISPKGVSITSQ